MHLHRLALAAACAAAGVLTVATPADAGAPTRVNDEYWSVTCVADLGGGHTIFLFGGGTTDGTEGGVGAFIEDAEGGMVAVGQASEYGFGSTFGATIDLDGS